MSQTTLAAVENNRKEVPFSSKRIVHHSALNFDQLLANLYARVGKKTSAEVLLGTPGSLQEFEAGVARHIGESGFVIISEIDYTQWVAKYGIQRRIRRWIFGNPLIAITMLKHDQNAALFVPPELLITESDNAKGCDIMYVLPSSLIVVEENAELLSAALALDAKIEALVTSVV